MQLGVGREGATVQPLGLQTVEEALHVRVISGFAWPVHALANAQRRQPSAELVGSVLHAAIAVEDQAWTWLALATARRSARKVRAVVLWCPRLQPTMRRV